MTSGLVHEAERPYPRSPSRRSLENRRPRRTGSMMERHLDLTNMTVVREAHLGFAGDDQGGGWTCRGCGRPRPLRDACLVRVRDPTIGQGVEYPLMVCETCRQQMPHRTQPVQMMARKVFDRS